MAWTNKRHEEVKKRCDAAAPGPWGWIKEDDGHTYSILQSPCDVPGHCHHGLGHDVSECGDPVLGCEDPYTMEEGEEPMDNRPSEEDGEFISHARTDLPDALEEIERLRMILGFNMRCFFAACDRLVGLPEKVGAKDMLTMKKSLDMRNEIAECVEQRGDG